MRLTLAKDDGDVLGTWNVPDRINAGQVENLLADGLHRHHHLDRCEECGGFFSREELIELPGEVGPALACQACANLPY